MSTESEQVRMLVENKLLKKRLKRLEEAVNEVLQALPSKRYMRTQKVVQRILEAALTGGDANDSPN